MSTMQVGYYDTFGTQYLHHAFAIVDGRISFPCYGGTSGEHQQFPAEFWTPIRFFSKSLGKSLPCNAYVARGLAEFGVPSDLSRTDYNRKSGGYLNLGDCSGIVYGFNGVCHQMCNVITVATVDRDIDWAPVNWPPSLSASWLLFSYRGTLTPGGPAAPFLFIVAALFARLRGLSYNVPEEELPTSKQLPGYFDDLYAAYHKTLKESLETKPQPETRAIYLENLLSGALGPATNAQSLLPPILEADTAFFNVKHELDNLLIRGKIGHVEFAETVNKAFAAMLDQYANVLSAEDFEKVFGSLPGDKPFVLTDPQEMPETYEGVKEALGL